MGDSDKTVALKLAYAQIILNTAKEAAARVMVSEKKAASFQHQLNCSKEESLGVLLRLKHMIDAKTIEAETTSFYQKRKIDELEAQLHEAEDIITDLRVELNCLEDKLERAKNTEVKPLNGQTPSEDASSLQDPTLEPTGYSHSRCCNSAKQIDQPNVSHVESYCSHNSDLATVLMANKKPELYRNGCTQRISALQRNFLDGKLTPGGLDGQHSLLRKQFSMETSAEDERQYTGYSPKIKNLKTMVFSGETKKSVKVCTIRRKRKTRFSRIKAGSRRFRPSQHMTRQSSSVLSSCRNYIINRNVKSCAGTCTVYSIGNMDTTKNSRELEEELQNKSSCHEDVVAGYNGKRNGKVKGSNDIATSFQSLLDHLTEPCQPSLALSCSKTSNSVCFNVESNEDKLKTADTENKIKALARLDPGLALIKCNVDPSLRSKNVTASVKALNNSRFAPSAADNDIKLGDESVLVRQEVNSGKISTLPSSEMSSTMVNGSIVHSALDGSKASNVTKESSTKVDNVNDRRFKYTFQRKRKKESLCDQDVKTSEESNLKRRAGEKENRLQETANCNLVNETSRDS
ncbi:uncharacterized protein LOC111292287 isoform X2 [Durio zibethinus]|uniref:Uncharacterized protein LOC111292287 isoform X2 n=1 Tax=Durio zibethinus TaxID=66656 RepID=A0A6P5YIK6_DURZI|nr:uncharacterized protein LOC111292287 isoform X2 [Durio zibethinus]